MKIHISKKSGSTLYKNLTACGTRPRRNAFPRIYGSAQFKEWAGDSEMVCEKCLKVAMEQNRI